MNFCSLIEFLVLLLCRCLFVVARTKPAILAYRQFKMHASTIAVVVATTAIIGSIT